MNPFYNKRNFSRAEIDKILDSIKGKTLIEVDSKHLIEKAVQARPDKVVRGIAGDIIEQSVLGFEKDNDQKPDMMVDGVETELKTTGVQVPKRDKERKFEAKEPLAITGVSPRNIVNEIFEKSSFFDKLSHILFVFYHYTLASKARVSSDYAQFPILGHLFWQLPKEELETLKNDWIIVKGFCEEVLDGKKEIKDIGQLKKQLMLIDTASPQRPRFRLKRAFTSTIVDTFLETKYLQSLPQRITKFDDIYVKCHQFTVQYKGKTLNELATILGIPSIQSKDACQKIIINLFGSNAPSINKIRDFNEIGLIAKTIILNYKGERTEDMKLFHIDFEEWFNPNISFGENENEDEDEMGQSYSKIYSYFSDHTFLFILFEEPYKPKAGEKIPLGECKFLGFKHYSFDNNFINQEVLPTWNKSRELVFSKTLKEIKCGARGFAPNFPKSEDHIIFFRGSGTTSKDRKARLIDWGINIKMYIQYVWLKGTYIVSKLRETPYI